MNCQDILELMLDPASLATMENDPAVGDHLEICSACRARLEYEKKMAEGFAFIADRQPPIQFADRILRIPQELASSPQTPAETVPTSWFKRFWFPGIASTALAGVMLAFGWTHLFSPTPVIKKGSIDRAVIATKPDPTPARMMEAPPENPVPTVVESKKEFMLAKAELPKDLPCPMPHKSKSLPESSPLSEPETLSRADKLMIAETAVDDLAPVSVNTDQEESLPIVIAEPLDNRNTGIVLARMADEEVIPAQTKQKAFTDRPHDNELAAMARNKKIRYMRASPKVTPVAKAKVLSAKATPEKRQLSFADTPKKTCIAKPVLARPVPAASVKPVSARTHKETKQKPVKLAVNEVRVPRDRRHKLLEEYLRSGKVPPVKGLLDINQWVLDGRLSVKDRIAISPPQGLQWFAIKRNGNWLVILTRKKSED